MSYSMGGQPNCFACRRPASRFDKQIGEWCCEGNPDCGISFGVTRQQRERQQILNRIQPILIAFGLSVDQIQEVMTRLALTELPLLRTIEVEGLAEVAERVTARKEPR